mmetsp:Transcript_33783/g.56736  ORF Transcript_33783/g.56736 Transcript_33783/m.56736 type:complete len:246 (+) Transcript_33783:706-1443(+)
METRSITFIICFTNLRRSGAAHNLVKYSMLNTEMQRTSNTAKIFSVVGSWNCSMLSRQKVADDSTMNTRMNREMPRASGELSGALISVQISGLNPSDRIVFMEKMYEKVGGGAPCALVELLGPLEALEPFAPLERCGPPSGSFAFLRLSIIVPRDRLLADELFEILPSDFSPNFATFAFPSAANSKRLVASSDRISEVPAVSSFSSKGRNSSFLCRAFVHSLAFFLSTFERISASVCNLYHIVFL